jgi:hypothetical protein
MKTRLAILVALAATGVSSSVYALPGDVAPPTIGLATKTAALYPSEQGAFKLLEEATQILESKIVQRNNCSKVVSYDFQVNTIYDGSGSAVLGSEATPGTLVKLKSVLWKATANDGRAYKISIINPSSLDGLSVKYVPLAAVETDLLGTGGFNIGSSIQVLNSQWSIQSPQTNTQDNFQGSIIKDYYRLVNFAAIPEGFDDTGTLVDTVLDYGYQVVQKKNFPKAKWWQQSRFWREDGVNAGTLWHKTRVAPKGCEITVRLEGYGEFPADGLDGFNEKGTIIVGPTAPTVVGPFKAI